MYNKERKTSFLEFYQTNVSNTYASAIFNRVEEYENLWNKDACDFTLKEIMEVLRSYGSGAIESLRYRTSFLRTYTNWCIVNNMSRDNMNHYDEVSTDILKQCVNRFVVEQKYITREQLLGYAKELVNPCDNYVLFALYEGLKGDMYQEITSLRRPDINIFNNTVKLCTGRTLEVSDELISFAIQSTEETNYYSTTSKGEPSFVVLQNNDYAFKSRVNISSNTPEAIYNRFTKRMLKIKSDLNAPNLSAPRLFNSGVATEIFKLIEKGYNTDNVFSSNEFSVVAKKYGLENKPDFQLRSMFKEYLN